jgi:hypothetical protein
MLATCVFSTSQNLLATYEMDARRRVEFTGGSRTVTTIDQMGSAYYETARGPLHGRWYHVWAPPRTRSPCSRRRSPHHHWISCHAMDLVEGVARQTRAEARDAGERPPRRGAAPHDWHTTGPAVRSARKWPRFGPHRERVRERPRGTGG